MSPLTRTREDVERLRRSVAMLAPGQPALGREEALELLAAVQQAGDELERLRRGLEALLAPPPDSHPGRTFL